MITHFQELFARLGLKRSRGMRTYAFDESIVTELAQQAKMKQVPAEELAADIMTTGLRQLKAGSVLKDHWDSLSPREQQATALTCLGLTNRQIAARLGIGEETAKTHVTNVLRKFNMHGKLEIQTALREWDFSDWE
jgi:DNA-binding CsgD family transcriptional regulator